MAQKKKVNLNISKKTAIPAIPIKKTASLSWVYIILSALVGMFGYLAVYLKFPNSYSIVVNLLFLCLLIWQFRSEHGLEVLLYALITTIVSVPLQFTGVEQGWTIIASLALNIIILAVIFIGLYLRKLWGFFVALIIFALAIINLAFIIITIVIPALTPSMYSILNLCRILSGMILNISFLIYLSVSKKYFC